MSDYKGRWLPVEVIEAEIGPERLRQILERLETEKLQRKAARKERAAIQQKAHREAIKKFNKLYATSEEVRNMGFRLWYDLDRRNKPL
jgi:hypothetical protein